MSARTILNFQSKEDVAKVIAAWAPAHGYKQQAAEPDGTQVWQKGVGFWVAPMMLSMRQQGDQVQLQAWIRAGVFVRAMSLFILPAQMGIQSGGFAGVLPRKIARNAVNQLLTQLGQTPVP